MFAAFERDGAVHLPGALDASAQERLAALFGASDRPGRRLTAGDLESAADLLAPAGPIGAQASSLLGKIAFPVRALLLEKSAAMNWQLGLHQDRTIAVRNRTDLPGFGPWTVKDGQLHVQPPQAIIDAMVTLRVHLDPVTDANGPLEVLPGSHRLGRLSERDIEELAPEVSSLIVSRILETSGPIELQSYTAPQPSETMPLGGACCRSTMHARGCLLRSNGRC